MFDTAIRSFSAHADYKLVLLGLSAAAFCLSLPTESAQCTFCYLGSSGREAGDKR